MADHQHMGRIEDWRKIPEGVEPYMIIGRWYRARGAGELNRDGETVITANVVRHVGDVVETAGGHRWTLGRAGA